VRGQAIDGGPARRVDAVTAAMAGRAAACPGPVACGGDGRERPGIPACVLGGPGRCHAVATCVHDPVPGQPPGGRHRRSRLPGCAPTSGPVHSTPAGRTTAAGKNFCCVTTRRRSFRLFQGLWHRLGALAARTLRLGVLGFGAIMLASSGLPLCCLPAPYQAQAFGILAVPLVPTPRLIAAPTAFAQADAWPRSPRTMLVTAVWLIMAAAHGRH
jgi:hypothetical protein